MTSRLQAALVFPSHKMKMFLESQKTTLSDNINVNADKSLTRTNIQSQTLCRAVNVVGTNLNLVTCGFIALFMKTFINVLSWGSILQFCNITQSHPHMSHSEPLMCHPYHMRSSHWPIGHLYHMMSSYWPYLSHVVLSLSTVIAQTSKTIGSRVELGAKILP